MTFFAQPVWKRAAVVFAGPLFNFLLAIGIFTAIFAYFGQPVVVDGQVVVTPRISAVQAMARGPRRGFRAGDLVKSVDGNAIDSFSKFQRVFPSRPKSPCTLWFSGARQRWTSPRRRC